VKPRTASALARASELGHRVATDDPRRPAEREFRDALDELSLDISRLTQAVERFRGNALNHVLFSGTGRIPAAGDAFWTTQTEVPFARVIILPIVNDLRIEATGPRDSGAAGAKEGRGMWWCPVAAQRLEIPLVGNVLTVYGAAGTFFDLALLANPIA
jgi:hypothetical protein